MGDVHAGRALAVCESRAALRTKVVGNRLVYLPQTGSTNHDAALLAQQSCDEGTAVIADYQTAGRGRLGRAWSAPPRSSLLLSVVLRPRLPPEQVQQITVAAALAVADALQERTGLEAEFKWPNDVMLGNRKIAGILCEGAVGGAGFEYVLVGIGLNVNLDLDELPQELRSEATSLSSILGWRVAREPLLTALLEALDRRWAQLRAGESPLDEWRARLITLGGEVSVSTPGGVLNGTAEAVDDSGALIVRTPDGGLVRVLSGACCPLRAAIGEPEVALL